MRGKWSCRLGPYSFFPFQVLQVADSGLRRREDRAAEHRLAADDGGRRVRDCERYRRHVADEADVDRAADERFVDRGTEAEHRHLALQAVQLEDVRLRQCMRDLRLDRRRRLPADADLFQVLRVERVGERDRARGHGGKQLSPVHRLPPR
jgi:hypothetical protein